MNTVLRPIFYALGLVTIIAASFVVGSSIRASVNYELYLVVAIAVAIIAVLAAVIIYLLESRRRRQG